MKNKFLLSILLMSVLGGIIYYNEKTYSPLKATDFQKLFPNYRGNVDKIYGKDFIGLSFHNELFELYLYKMMENVSINENYPKFEEWEKNEIINKKENSSTWKKCPMDIKEKEKFKDVIALEVFKQDMYGKNFNAILNNSNNYYTYVYINELEYYFFLFNKDKGELYYIRKAGKINNFKRIKTTFLGGFVFFMPPKISIQFGIGKGGTKIISVKAFFNNRNSYFYGFNFNKI